MSHTVTITKLPDEESDDYEYEFGGTHGPDCEVYVECKRKACQAMDPERGDERFRHGRRHFHRDGDWLVESDICGLCYVFEYTGDIETFAEAGVTLGIYPIIVAWEDTWWLEVQDGPLPDRTIGLEGER